MAPSDSSRCRDGLGLHLVPLVAVATRTPRGLPCSTCSLGRVPSLQPRRSPPLHSSSCFAASVVFARQGEARPPRCITGLHAGSLLLRPTSSLFPGFGGD